MLLTLLACSSSKPGTVTPTCSATFERTASATVPLAGGLGLAAGDLDPSGGVDLAIVESVAPAIAVLLGDGAGAFTEGRSTDIAILAQPALAADLDADGLTDLVVAGEGFVQVLMASGGGRFDAESFDAVGFVAQLAAADLDGDGDLDVAGATDGAALTWSFSGGELEDPEVVDDGLDGGVAIADLDRDGGAELIRAGDGVVEVDGTSREGAGTGHTAVATGDFDGDGNADVVTASADGVVALFLGDGDGGLADPVTREAGYEPEQVAVADFDGDGFDDVIVPSASNEPLVALCGGELTRMAELESEGTMRFLATGDFDADGRPDLAASTFAAMEIAIWLTRGE